MRSPLRYSWLKQLVRSWWKPSQAPRARTFRAARLEVLGLEERITPSNGPTTFGTTALPTAFGTTTPTTTGHIGDSTTGTPTTTNDSGTPTTTGTATTTTPITTTPIT